MKGIAPGIQGPIRLRIIKYHRLYQFILAFDAYLAGRCAAKVVKARARKMLEIGLPDEIGRGV
ncbi:MAG: hypothetical protein PHU23_12870 [Dehalococcoidales bacterium]|nr:hypothetical protein [Dehalococcoidales bacterium]